MFYEIELYDNVTYQSIEPLELPEVLIPEDFDIWVNQKQYENRPCTWLCEGGFFVILKPRNGGDFLTIEEYIKSKPKFHLMPYMTIYAAITELIKDGFIKENAFAKVGGSDVAVHKQKSAEQGCRRLYSSGNFHGNR